jgi:L-proline amide hydrolase
MSTREVEEGTLEYRGNSVWYRVVGSAHKQDSIPLLCLHGGPGATWDYLQPFDDLADNRTVVFYDQTGSGNSAVVVPHDPAMWTVELFVEEVDAVRGALGLDRCHILGQSWGGMLAMEYLLRRPNGVISLILESSPASMLQWSAELSRLVTQLPTDVQETLRAHEAAGTTDDPAYEQAVLVFYRRHLCRLTPWPDYVERTFAKLSENSEVYNTMNGPSEFYVTGTLKNWTIVDRLGEIAMPVLIMSGRYDEATPAIADTVHKGIPGSKWVLFENSSHMCHAEERDRCMKTVANFLTDAERDLGSDDLG